MTATRSAAPGLLTELATWPPVEVVDVDGWRAGLSGGFTRRGNSVAAVAAPADPEAALDRVEALYAAHGQPPVVRVCAASRPADLDARLERRGYGVAATTLVMAADVRTVGAGEGPGGEGWRLEESDRPEPDWLRGWLDVKATAPVDLGLAGRLLGGAPAAYLRLVDGAGTVGVVRAAPADGWLAISCLVVQPRARRRGVGRMLTLEALRRAGAAGASAAFLQVERANVAAVALYAGLGFTVVDRYHYRERRPRRRPASRAGAGDAG